MNEILIKLQSELSRLKTICDNQFKERFASSKNNDRWADDLFKDYQSCMIKIELLNELLSK